MSSGKYSFAIEQGTTVDFEVQYTDVNGDPIDLTDYSGRMQIKSAFADNNPITYATLSSSLLPDGTGLNFGGQFGDKPASSGSIGIYISANTSSLFPFIKAKYDLELYSGSEYPKVVRLLEGTITNNKQVTT
jgi:hypothetical protein